MLKFSAVVGDNTNNGGKPISDDPNISKIGLQVWLNISLPKQMKKQYGDFYKPKNNTPSGSFDWKPFIQKH